MPIFVVQQHAARRLHYDFRLEVGGVLRSWAVPRGPSTNPADRRLAVPVDDHDMSHARFEGRIGTGDRGAGAVIVWDTGEYENAGHRPLPEALAAGHAVFLLHGSKLRGRWALQRVDEDRWLLIKADDEHAHRERDVVAERPESALSGRTIEELG